MCRALRKTRPAGARPNQNNFKNPKFFDHQKPPTNHKNDYICLQFNNNN